MTCNVVGCDSSSSDFNCGALEANSVSESSSSKSSSRLTFDLSSCAGDGASSIAVSCVPGSLLMATCDIVREELSAGVDSGVTE